MSDVPKPNDGEVVSNRLPVPYVTQYTDKTHILSPFLVPGIAAGAFLMVEWGTLRWMDHAPTLVWLANTAIGLCVLIVVALKDWLTFRSGRYFPISLIVLLIAWVAILGFAYWDASPLVTKESSEGDRDTLVTHLVTALSERDIARRDLAAVKRDLEAARAKPPQQPPPAPSAGGPISWQNRLILGAAPTGVQYAILTGSVVSSSAIQLKDAYIVSDLTGERRNFLISTRAHNLDAERLPLHQINPLPSGTEIWLVVQWDPPLSISDFSNRWGKMHLTINYGEDTYTRFIDENEIKSDLLSDIPGADLVLGIPRVTKRSPE